MVLEVSDSKAEEGDPPLLLRLIDENKTLKSFLRKADDAFRVDSISSYVCGFDSWIGGAGTCGAEKCWDDDNTLATAYTACTACTDYTGYYTAGTFRSEATFDSRGTYDTYRTYDTTESTEKDNDIIVESEDEQRDGAEENSGITDDDASAEATVAAANLLAERKEMGLSEIPIILPVAIEFNAKEQTIPWKDYSNQPIITPAAAELTEEDFYTRINQTTEKKTSIVSRKVRYLVSSGLRKSTKSSS